MAKQIKLGIVINAFNHTNKAFGIINNSLRNLKNQTTSTTRSFRSSFRGAMDLSAVADSADRVAHGIQSAISVPIRTAVQFEESMAKVQAVTGATGLQFDAMRRKAQELGERTAFSAREAAGGMEFLARAGFNTNQIIDAMPATLRLAQASNTDLARTADIASNVLTGFGMRAKEMSRAADVFAAATAKSNTDLSQLGEAMKFVAPDAKNVGYSLEETTAIIGKLSDAGIQASMAGTGLRAMINRLAAQTPQATQVLDELGISVVDKNGKLKKIPEVMAEFSAAFQRSGLTSTQQLKALDVVFGDVGKSAFTALMGQGIPAIEALTQKLRESKGTAENMAKTMDNTTAGSIKKMQSAMESAQITIGNNLLPTLTSVTQVIAHISSKFSQFSNENKELVKMVLWGGGALFVFAKTVSVVGVAINGVVAHVFFVGKALIFLAKATGLAQAATWAFNAAWSANPLGVVIGLVVALGTAVFLLAKNWEQVTDFIKQKWQELKQFFIDAKDAVMGFLGMENEEKKEPFQSTNQALQKTAKTAKKASDAIQGIQTPALPDIAPKIKIPEMPKMQNPTAELRQISTVREDKKQAKNQTTPSPSSKPNKEQQTEKENKINGLIKIAVDIKNQTAQIVSTQGFENLQIEANTGYSLEAGL